MRNLRGLFVQACLDKCENGVKTKQEFNLELKENIFSRSLTLVVINVLLFQKPRSFGATNFQFCS